MERRFVVATVSRGIFGIGVSGGQACGEAKFFARTTFAAPVIGRIPRCDSSAIGRHVRRGLKGRQEEKGASHLPPPPQSRLRLLSNMSTGLDVEKLSLEDSDVSFSELATRCRGDHLYSVVVRRYFDGVSYYCGGADWLMARFLFRRGMPRSSLSNERKPAASRIFFDAWRAI